MRLLYWKVCLFLSFTSIENIIESTSAMCALHSSRGQFKLPIIPWIVNKTTATPCVLADNKVTSHFHFVASYHKTGQGGHVCYLLSGIWFWPGFSTIQCGLFLLSWCCSRTFQISDTPFLVTIWYACDDSCRYTDFFCIFMQVAFPYMTLQKLP